MHQRALVADVPSRRQQANKEEIPDPRASLRPRTINGMPVLLIRPN